ncbi:uncharacterized protein [Physcomitrium patens]|uniref:uncharacterized protein n=1 Tax=Physcomitrium patens TaxID=3218 RepID=UPI003CCDB702
MVVGDPLLSSVVVGVVTSCQTLSENDAGHNGRTAAPPGSHLQKARAFHLFGLQNLKPHSREICVQKARHSVIDRWCLCCLFLNTCHCFSFELQCSFVRRFDRSW